MSFSLARPTSLLHRLAAFRERHGIRRALAKAADKLLHKLGAKVYTVVWLNVNSLAELAPADPQFEFRFLTLEEVERYVQDPVYYFDPGIVERVRSGRERCFAALAGDRLAAVGCYVFGYSGPEQADGVAMSYPPDVAYMSYGVTHPDFRGARLHGHIMALPLKELAKEGVPSFVSLVAWTNWASLKSCDRLGWIRLGNMIAFGTRRRTIGLYPKAAKQRGVRFGRRARRA